MLKIGHTYSFTTVKPRNSGSHCNGNLALMDNLTRPDRSPYTPYVKGFPCSGSLYNGNLAVVEKFQFHRHFWALSIMDLVNLPMVKLGAEVQRPKITKKWSRL